MLIEAHERRDRHATGPGKSGLRHWLSNNMVCFEVNQTLKHFNSAVILCLFNG